MANKVTMNICGQEYTLVADESAAYMEKVGALVDERMRQVLDALHVSQTDAAVLAAVKNRNDLFLQAVRGVPGVRVLYITRENREGLFRLLKRDLAQAE